jgi:hypothetical protein
MDNKQLTNWFLGFISAELLMIIVIIVEIYSHIKYIFGVIE